MQKIAAVITAAAIIVPQAAIYADPDESDIVTDSGAADIIDAPSEDSEAIGDDNTNSGGSISSSEDSSSDNLIDNAVSNDSTDDEHDNIVYEDDENSDAAVTADATAEPTATPEPKQTRLINGDFEYPALNDKASTIFGDNWSNCGPWYVKDRETIKTNFDSPADFENKFGWYTTEGDGKIEMILAKDSEGNLKEFVYPSNKSLKKTVKDYYYGLDGDITYGKQFAELCAEDQSSLYQTISTTPGAVLSWGLRHRGRRPDKDMGGTLSSGIDTMALFIGKAQEGSLIKPEKGRNNGTEGEGSKNDIFMWMAQVLKDSGKIDYETTSKEEPECFSVYSEDNVLAEDVNWSNYKEKFSLSYSKDTPKEWKCWIITDGQSWGLHSGTYEVETGQTETTFAFTALTGIRTQQTNGKYDDVINEGNLLDDVTFSASYPLNVSTTASGTGTVTISDENYTVDKRVDKDTTHNDNYLDGTEVTITATPNNDEGASSCSFIGAYIDGTMYEAGNSKFDYDEDSNTYTFTEIINKPRNIQLIFAKASTVTYDPNGGTFNGTKENTEYKIVAASDENSADRVENDTFEGYYNNTASAVPNDTEKSKFIGWYFARGNSLIAKEHRVEYIKAGDSGNSTNNDVLRVSYNSADEEGNSPESASADYDLKKDVPATSGVTFVAQYEHLQKAIVVVKDKTDILYKEPRSEDTKDYGTVNTTITSTINLTDGIELISDSYGRTSSAWGKDIENTAVMHMKLASSGEYMFMGWYTEANGGEKLSDASIYSYPISGPRTVYARFSKKLQYPYLSFVARDNGEATTLNSDIPFSKGSHIAVGENIVSTYDGKGIESISNEHSGGSQYGNTISTGFVANINKTNASDLTSKYCTWTITIPADGTYIKTDDSSEINGVTLGGAVLSDAAGDTGEKINDFYNKGNICKVKNINNTEGKLTLKLYDVLPAAVSGEMTITYGIIIDNLYAPGAEAAMTFDNEDGAVNISQDGDGIIHSNDFNSYVSGSPYAKQNTN